MLEQKPHITGRDTDELQIVVSGQTIVPGPRESQKLPQPIEPLKPEVAKYLKKFSFFLIVSDETQISKQDIQSPVEIYYIEETDKFWIRCCSNCIQIQNKPKAKLLAHLGITLENSTFTDTYCLDCACDEYRPKKKLEEIQTETAKLATDVQK